MEILKQLEEWGNLAHDKEEEFLKEFATKDAWTLTQVSWDSENIRFVYVVECGMHVADRRKMEEWLKFVEKHKQ